MEVVPFAAGFQLFGWGASGVPLARESDRFGDVDDREGASGTVGPVGPGAVEGAAVVEGDSADLHLHCHGVGQGVASRLHPVADALTLDLQMVRVDVGQLAESVRAGHELEAAVLRRAEPQHVLAQPSRWPGSPAVTEAVS